MLAEEKRQAIVVEPLASAHAWADRRALRQALINLVDNAIKFSPPGGRVRMRVTDTPDAAIIEVIDSGRGIAAADRRRIFDRFYRASNGAGQPGAGLGLSIAKGAVEATGGRLTLEASGPGGSTFRIALPASAFRFHVATEAQRRTPVPLRLSEPVHAKRLAATDLSAPAAPPSPRPRR